MTCIFLDLLRIRAMGDEESQEERVEHVAALIENYCEEKRQEKRGQQFS